VPDRPDSPRANQAPTAAAPARTAPTGAVSVGGAVSGASTVGSAGTSATPSRAGQVPLVDEQVTWGLVESYAVDAERLRIKLNVSAIGRTVVWVGADEPHFKTAVSMAMMAHHTAGTKLTVRYAVHRVSTPPSSNVIHALELGIGNDPEEALAFDEWLPLA
jgi:hypothetical protein